MKKFLALVVALAMVLSSMSFALAAAPSDVNGHKYEDAISRLSSLGVISGYTDGTFKPDNTITRAEFATLLVKLLGYADAASATSATTKFSDTNGHWATGSINMATGLGVIKGMPNGTFAPDAPVSYQDAVTMIVRALGYEPSAVAKGGYPAGFLAVAAANDIMDDVKGAYGAPATRGMVAELLDNSLEVAYMVQINFGTETKYIVSGDTNNNDIADDGEVALESFLNTGLGFDMLPNVTISDVDEDDLEVELNNDQYNYKDFAKISKSMEGYIGDAWADGDDIVYFKNETTVVYDYVDEIDGDDADYNFTALNDSTTEDDMKLALSGKKYEFRKDTNDDVDLDANCLNRDDANLIGSFVKVYLNSDDEIYRIDAYDFENSGLVQETKADYVEYTEGATEDKKFRGIEDADDVLVLIDGEEKTYADIKAGMYVDLWSEDSESVDDYVIVASTKTVEGTLDDVDVEEDDVASISDKDYDIVGSAFFSTNAGDDYVALNTDLVADDLLGESITAYLTYEGKVAYIKGDTDTTSDFYGFVVRAWEDENDKIKVFRSVDGEGKNVTYNLDLDTATSDYDDVAALQAIENNGIGSVMQVFLDGDGEVERVMDIPAGTNIAVNADNEFSASKDAIRNAADVDFYLDDDVVIINTDGDSDGTEDDPEIVKWSEIENLDPQDAVIYVSGTAATDSELVVITADFDSITGSDEFVALVTDRIKKTGDDYELTLVDAAGTETKVLLDEGETIPAESDFISYTKEGTDRIVTALAYGWDEAAVGGVWLVDEDVDDINGNWMTVDGDVYRVANDVIVYQIDEDDDVVDAGDLSDIEDVGATGATIADSVQCLVVDDVIKAIFFQKEADE